MANEVQIIIKATNLASSTLRQPQDDLDKLKAKAEATQVSMGNLGGEVGNARTRVEELGSEFNRTDNIGLFKGASGDLRELENVSRRVGTSVTTDLEKAGTEGVQGFGDALMQAAPIVLPIAAALGVEIAAALGGGVLALGGGGAIAAGIMMQLKSPVVHGAVDDLGHYIMGSLSSASDAFKQPLLAGIDELKQGLSGPLSEMSDVFKQLAPYVELFGRELGQAAQVFMPMFASALKDAGPVLGVIAHELPTLAQGLGDFFQQIGHGAKGGAEALDVFIKAFSLGLSGLGYAIRAIEDVWDFLVQTLDKGTGLVSKMFGWIPGVGSALKDLHNYVHGVATSFDDGKISSAGFSSALGTGGLTGSVLTASGAFQQLAQATLTWKNDALDAKTATLQFKDGLASLKQQLAQNKAGFNENTAAGRQNVEALNQLAQSAQDVANKTYAATGSSKAAAQAYQQARDQVLSLAQQGHATTSEIAALNAALDEAVKVRHGEIDIEVNLTGSGAALVENQGTLLLSGTGVKARAHGGITGAASGGPRSNLTMVGEHGPELVSLAPGSQVYSNPDTQRMLSESGAIPQRDLTIHFAGNVDSALATAFQKLVRTGVIKIYQSQVIQGR